VKDVLARPDYDKSLIERQTKSKFDVSSTALDGSIGVFAEEDNSFSLVQF
jgi:hypothetical protein